MTRTDPTSPEALARLVRDFTTESLRLSSVLADAHEIQWSPSPIPKPRDDTSERAKGGHSDPTPLHTFDERRLLVRERVTLATGALEDALSAARRARSDLEAAIDHWTGS